LGAVVSKSRANKNVSLDGISVQQDPIGEESSTDVVQRQAIMWWWWWRRWW